ncbi:DnaB-like helicase C-terminal domain-containing protein [Streptomyces sp. CS081A]|uniref:replicative DNA helicase n=1 Tax=Streptomyces TaxID=1883 RepID=UPI0013A57215|nr:DnaB-like helicase C-terminal domain-containing protein [Streptomyces sp. CS081A]
MPPQDLDAQVCVLGGMRNAAHCAEIAHERAVLRRLVEAGTTITQLGYAAEGELDEIVSKAQAEVHAVTEERTAKEPGSKIPAIMERVVNSVGTLLDGEITGIPTGFVDLDPLTKGRQPGRLVIGGARPAVGKSTLALDFARAAAIEHGRKVALFSLERGEEEVGMRLLSVEARVAPHHLRGDSDTMTESDWERLDRYAPEMRGLPLWMDYSTKISPGRTRSRIEHVTRETGRVPVVIVDYLQLMTSLGTRRDSSRQEDISEISRGLKILAKSLSIPVIAFRATTPTSCIWRRPDPRSCRVSNLCRNLTVGVGRKPDPTPTVRRSSSAVRGAYRGAGGCRATWPAEGVEEHAGRH